MTDPIFGRDIGFFLFELPFLRLVQGLFNALVVGALLVTLARYLVSATHGGLVFTTQVRVHLAVLAGLFLLSVAFGYQLDKLELVYSTRGVATGVSYTDQNAQFFAFDVADGHLRAGGRVPRGRRVHPRALAAGAGDRASGSWRRSSSGGSTRRRPALHGRPEPVRPGGAVHRQQHRDDPARLRARTTGSRPAVHGRRAAHRRSTSTPRSRHVPNARLWDYRPAAATRLDQLQTVRQYYDFTGRRHGPLHRSTTPSAR